MDVVNSRSYQWRCFEFDLAGAAKGGEADAGWAGSVAREGGTIGLT